MKICSPAIYSKDLDATHFPTITKSDVRRVVKSNHEGHVHKKQMVVTVNGDKLFA